MPDSEQPVQECPTCGIDREHDGPHYPRALKAAGKPVCPDSFHDYGEAVEPDPSPVEEGGKRCPTCEKPITLSAEEANCLNFEVHGQPKRCPECGTVGMLWHKMGCSQDATEGEEPVTIGTACGVELAGGGVFCWKRKGHEGRHE